MLSAATADLTHRLALGIQLLGVTGTLAGNLVSASRQEISTSSFYDFIFCVALPSEAELPRDLEVARPQTAGEEELQLQLALAMSREEAEQEEQKRRSDDVRLQLALSQSQQDFK